MAPERTNQAQKRLGIGFSMPDRETMSNAALHPPERLRREMHDQRQSFWLEREFARLPLDGKPAPSGQRYL